MKVLMDRFNHKVWRDGLLKFGILVPESNLEYMIVEIPGGEITPINSDMNLHGIHVSVTSMDDFIEYYREINREVL